MNAAGVDLNRNFPSKNWNENAMKYWKTRTHKNARRFPGVSAASEPETRCAMQQIEDYAPDFIISIHSPYGVLDFDGPNVYFPKYRFLPWHSLGTFPGSLGQYMWKDHHTPVLTIELKDNAKDADNLQDLIGGFAIRTVQRISHRADGSKSPFAAR
jgi:hypothetical protein